MNTTLNTEDLFAGIIDIDNAPAIQFLEVGEFYKFNGHYEVFSSSFVFEVIKDNHDYYDIKIDNEFGGIIPKDFQLLEAFNNKLITKIYGYWGEISIKE